VPEELKRCWPYARAAAGPAAVGAFLLILGAGVELLLPWPLKWLVDGVFGSQPPPHWLVSLWPAFGEADVGRAVLGICLAILLLAIVQQSLAAVSQLLLIRAGWRIVLGLRQDVMDHLHRLSLTYHDRTKVGESLYRVAYDTQAAQSMLSQGLAPFLTAIGLVVGVLVVMSRLDRGLTLAVLAVAPVFAFAIRGFGRRIEARSAAYHARESALVSLVQESLSSMRAVKAFTLEPQAGRRFAEEAKGSVRESERLALNQLLFSAAVGIVMAGGTAAVVWLGARQVARGAMYLGDILIFLAYLGMLYRPISSFSSGIAVIRTARAQLRRVSDLLAMVPEVQDRPDAKVLPRLAGRIEFSRVSFAYEADRPVLHEIDLVAEPGQAVALVGPTGAGKTTLAGLLLRFYDPTTGVVRLDGHDVRELRLEWLRRQIAVVLQDPILFSGTVGENIAYGRPGATREELEQAARRAQAHEFIARLPRGYDTMIGERGVRLSGGQRQRLSIARAFLKDAPILLLDEPTSALDPGTEADLLLALGELMRGRTTLIIAHRLAMVRHANLIVVLEGGRVVDRGSHEELLERSARYRRLYRQHSPELADELSGARIQTRS
jgi:ATP-binding cassette subfamily B protein